MGTQSGTTSASTPPSWAFLVDENLPRSLTAELLAQGYSAEHVRDMGMGGAKDPAVYAYAQAQDRTIITGDKDFGDMRTYHPPHAGIVVVEVPDTMPPVQRNSLILRQLSMLAGQSLRDILVIVEPTRMRIRR